MSAQLQASNMTITVLAPIEACCMGHARQRIRKHRGPEPGCMGLKTFALKALNSMEQRPSGDEAGIHLSREGIRPRHALRRRHLASALELAEFLKQLRREGWTPLEDCFHNLAPTWPG